MDRFVLDVKPRANISLVVKLDGEAAAMLYEIQRASGADKKYIVSEMIKFCYERCEIKKCSIGGSETKCAEFADTVCAPMVARTQNQCERCIYATSAAEK